MKNQSLARYFLLLSCLLNLTASAAPNYSVKEAVDSRLDLWGDAALKEPNGPSYEFFKSLLPPLRYVNADFRVYPIVLSAPNGKKKARLIANGSGLNLRANTRSSHDFPLPVFFRVGPVESPFGENVRNLDGPHLVEGYLPIVQMTYEHNGFYTQESFASVDPVLSSNAVVLTRFSFKTDSTPEHDKKGIVTIRLDAREALKVSEGAIQNEKGDTLVWFDRNWTWDTNRQVLTATFTEKKNLSATLAIPTTPVSAAVSSPLIENGYDEQRKNAFETWKTILSTGMNVETPEPVVNNAWRALLLQNFSIINGDSFRYSTANQYDALYETEGSDALMATMWWGFEGDTRRLMVPLLDFIREGIKYQQAGTKLQNVARYYWQTRDREFVKSVRVKWEKEIQRISQNLGTNGLLPRERYCNDIATPIFSLNSNSKCWRGLRDLSAALKDMGETAEAERLAGLAKKLRSDILNGVEKSVVTNTQPPFIPVALFGEEPPPDPICATKMGSYWNLLVNFVIGNEALGPGSKYEDWLLRYIQQHGGLCMGMERSRPWPGWWSDSQNVNPLYGTRYVLALLRRDEAERALVSFYGMLAQGFTPETFYAGEGSSIIPSDEFGRQISLPPNSAGNAHLLTMLRYLLVQDLDLNDDGEPETLHLGFATPKGWLEDGKNFKVERAPTAFGPVSFKTESHLKDGKVISEVELPSRNVAGKILLRARVPDGWRVISATTGSETLKPDEYGTVDLSALKGKQTIRFNVVSVRQ